MLQGDRDTVRQNTSAIYIHHCGQMHKATGHTNVGSIQGPYLVAVVNRQLAQQVWKHFVWRVALAGTRLWHKSADAHFAHQGLNMQHAH